MFDIHLLPATYGDAILVTYGDADHPHYLLIDGGPYSDYKTGSLEEKVWQSVQEQIASSTATLDLLVVTHVDADHIEGIVKLLNQQHLHYQPVDVWFNGWDHLNDRLGAVEGELLSTQIVERHLPWNDYFGGRAVVCRPSQPLPAIELDGGMKITLLSPTLQALGALVPKWEKVVRKAGLEPGKPVSRTHTAWAHDLLGGEDLDIPKLAGHAFRNDRTEANGSSIAFLAEYGGKACLFAADARSAILEKAIRTLLQQRGQSTLRLDAFKLSHHGSKANLGPGLLKLLDCQRYLVLTNGDRFDHPDDVTLARILQHSQQQAFAAPTGQPASKPSICFNYRTARTEPWEDPDLQAEYDYHTAYPEPGDAGLVIHLAD